MLIQLGTAVALMLLFAGLMLILQSAFASNHEYDDYQHVICNNGVWYPEGTDCKVALKKYYEEWHQIGEQVKAEDKERQEQQDKKVCEDYNGEWKDIGGRDRGCVINNEQDQQRYGMRPGFSLDSTGSDAEYGIEDLVTYDNDGNKIYPETDSSEEEREKQDKRIEEVCNEVDGKLNDKGECVTDNDGPKADKFHEKLVEKEQEDEGKRYVNPDGGSPLYEDELTEDEKDYYEEYKPEKESKIEIHNETPEFEVEDEEAVEEELEEIEEENTDRSYEYEGEDESTETEESEEFEEE